MSSETRVLVINCGSSSMKFSVLPTGENEPVLSGVAEKLGLSDAFISIKDSQGKKSVFELAEGTHAEALKKLFATMSTLQLMDSLCAIGHRVAHGGSEFSDSVLVTEEIIAKIEQLSDLAPLHNPANLVGIETAMTLLPTIPNVAVFDTAFHQTMSEEAYTYAIPLELRDEHKVRRYGFHGTSHRFVAIETVKRLDLDKYNHGIIVAHLGNGSSVCAVKDGISVDTSMGMTPLEGLVMGTRCGDLDFGAAVYIANSTKQSLDSVYSLSNSQSGLLGVSGLSSDCRELEQARSKGNKRAALAIDVLVHRLARHIGGHLASLDRIDALVFTGGIGENSVLIRELVIQKLAVFGFKLDKEKNATTKGGEWGVVSTVNSPAIVVLPTNEEKVIAQDAAALA
ncbi:propionate kinase [Vibrio methylphosphonaticus]|uniref:propionate kinase n=1 Tax=Vibrio methylphosphonaticus TaxID=2946866 RepID=UPI00202A3AE3|nr:propionate kinase [Vibrio methylphosphonaticus]MCL9774028.1 propionate kinase [Vibrio methylphosphonaticus]